MSDLQIPPCPTCHGDWEPVVPDVEGREKPKCPDCFQGYHPDTIERLGEIIDNEGWTCEAHEPHGFGECSNCVGPQTSLVVAVLDSLTGDTE